jgi:hypothetical protein
MKNLKALSIIAIIPLLMTGCFGSGSDTTSGTQTTDSTKKLYETTDFSIEIPQDWEILERADLRPNIPQETVVAFRNNIKSDIFTANVNISMETVGETVNSSDYAKNSKISAQKNLVSFEEISSQSYNNGTTTGTILEFSGKKTSSDPIVKFQNLYIVNNGSAYTITGAYLPAEDETIVKNIGEMINSFLLK